MKRLLFSLLVVSAPLGAQSLMDRSPNLSGTWVPDPAVIQFNFLHRFHVANSAGFNTVTNFPTFTLALGLPANLGLGIHYATKTDVPSKVANEVEFYGRWRHPLGSGFTLAVTPAFNAAARSLDGEVGVNWTTGPLTLLGAVRGMTKPYGVDTARLAVAGGAVVHLNSYIGLSADVASFTSAPRGVAAWSAGLVFVIPGSPHTFSVQVSNVDVNTIEGSSHRGPGAAGKPLYGFEFTIPLHLARFRPWFHKEPEYVQPPNLRMIPSVQGPAAAEVKMNGIHYRADTVTVNAGEIVRWVNGDPLIHTVSFDDGSGTSADIPQNGSFEFKFEKPGTYPYHCTQHPFMRGVVIVR
ncbi:MAG TPA: cupredoxin family copper-binding protein [Gemmatimonadales bacterium]|nr:cupredoxin family copper-binding protein [Gemmatimonadales bacterium]